MHRGLLAMMVNGTSAFEGEPEEGLRYFDSRL